VKRHPFDPISFVFGIAFAFLGMVASVGGIHQGTLRLHWLGPLTLLAIGAAILALGGIREWRSRSQREPAPATDNAIAEADEDAD
jgi:hypothetical protein